MFNTRTNVLLLLLTAAGAAEIPFDMKAPEVVLWPSGAPGSAGMTTPEKWITHAEAVPGEEPVVDPFHRVTNIHNPSITVFLPPKDRATGSAYVIAPGGGHKYLLIDVEGSFVAERLNRMGIAAFVLKSRLARAPGSTYKVEVESLADAQRAIRMVRSRAKEWNVDPARIGIMGFSAGGEIAALAETRFDAGQPTATDPVERQSSRPDFVVLGYPGLRPAQLAVTKQTPPTFLLVSGDDNPAQVSAEYFVKLKQAGVPAELHIFTHGGHGFGMSGKKAEYAKLPVAKWPERLQEWMDDMGLLK